MTRFELEQYILETYNANADRPWIKYPNYEVFRHALSRKWFAVILDVPKEKFGLPGTELIDVVNLKCDPILTGSLRSDKGIFPAYHMNKSNWISVALDGSVSADKIKILLDMSYELTSPKIRKTKRA